MGNVFPVSGPAPAASLNVIADVLLGAYAAGFLIDMVLRRRSPTLLKPVPTAGPAPSSLPRVSIVVPARNSARTISACVGSLVSLSYPNKEVIVVEGNSSDGTAEALKGFGQKIRVIPEPPLPPGWVGKDWACHQGFLASDGEFILFTDADVVHSPDSLGDVISYVTAEKVDVVSLSTRAELTATSEKAVLPLVFMLVLNLARRKKVNDDRSKVAFAIGAFILFSRGAYSAFGGHEAVKDKIDEDVELATLARGKGSKVRVLDGSALLQTRMYESGGSLFTGLVRNVYGMTRRSLGDTLQVAGEALLRFFLPFVAFVYGAVEYSVAQDWAVLALAAAVALLAYADYGLFARRLGVGVREMVLLPFSSVAVLSILAVAAARAATGAGVSWRGRVYSGG